MRTVLHTFGRAFSVKITGEGLKNLADEIRTGLDNECAGVDTEPEKADLLLRNILTDYRTVRKDGN